ncbi:hypothetical protein BDW71DRAFT_204849 [Aspergillus fruticulosus]
MPKESRQIFSKPEQSEGLAWIMGFVGYQKGRPNADSEIKVRYEDHILDHTGIRLVEQRQRDTAGPHEQETLLGVGVTEDPEPLEVSGESAEDWAGTMVQK